MKIFLISDIHTEKVSMKFDPLADYESLRFNYPKNADVIVLAGDIGEWNNGLEWARHKFKNKKIVFVPGNHEYYDSDLSIESELRSKSAELGIYYLNNNEIIIDEVRFLGCTLWTDLNGYDPDTTIRIFSEMNDYRYITAKKWWSNARNKNTALWLMNPDSVFGFDPSFFSPTISYLLHKKSLNWLKQKLEQGFHGKTVVVTHHAPTMKTTNHYAYGSELESFIKENSSNINLWCHGHIHKSADYKVGGVRIVCNARGYPTDYSISKTFDENKLIYL